MVVPMITVKNLSKDYGAKKVVADLNFTIGKGEILILDEPTTAAWQNQQDSR